MKEKQKGISIYLVIVMISVLLAVILGLTSTIIGGANIAQNLGFSVKAFHAADTGIEKVLYNIKNANCTTPVSGNFNGDSTYSYTVTITHNGGGTCSDAGTNIDSLGQYKTVKRKIEASY